MLGLFLLVTNVTKAVNHLPVQKNYHSVFELTGDDLINLERTGLEAKIGRKLTIKERLLLKIVKRKLRKNAKLTGENAAEQVQTDGFAIAGFVTGLIGIFIFGMILGIFGIVFSALALKRIKREPETRKGRGLAIAGLVLGIVALVGAVIIVASLA